MEESFAEVDISEQIDNKWNKDTALVIKKKGTYYSVKIKSKDKNDLKFKFIKEEKNRNDIKHNRRVVVLIYCFILFHLLKLSDGISKEVKLCNDVSPKWAVHNYLTFICKEYKYPNLLNKIKISFKEKKDGKSKAHYAAKNVAKGRQPANLTFKKSHIDKLKYIIKNSL